MLEYDKLPKKCFKCSWLRKNNQDERFSYCPLFKCIEDIAKQLGR